jgi:Fic family protein
VLIPPKYTLTPKISQALASIESAKEVINSLEIPIEIEQNIRRKSTLRSSLYSARIEGNDLTLEELERNPSRTQKKAEVFNILKALNWVYERRFKDITLKDILQLHQMSMLGLVEKPDLGKFRTNMEAIFNSSGIAIYLPPRPSQVTPLLNKLLTYLNSNKEPLIPIKAVLAHYTFEKIHPFLDGNGRVGRLFLQAILQKEGYGMKGLLALEEFLDNHRAEYYRSLEEVERDTTDYIEFMLEAIAVAGIEAKDQVLKKEEMHIEDYLLPRRAEILNIIKDQRLVSFDQIRRRFMGVNERTLRYDLKKLQDQGLIRKRGTTKGVYYEYVNQSI